MPESLAATILLPLVLPVFPGSAAGAGVARISRTIRKAGKPAPHAAFAPARRARQCAR